MDWWEQHFENLYAQERRTGERSEQIALALLGGLVVGLGWGLGHPLNGLAWALMGGGLGAWMVAAGLCGLVLGAGNKVDGIEGKFLKLLHVPLPDEDFAKSVIEAAKRDGYAATEAWQSAEVQQIVQRFCLTTLRAEPGKDWLDARRMRILFHWWGRWRITHFQQLLLRQSLRWIFLGIAMVVGGAGLFPLGWASLAPLALVVLLSFADRLDFS